MPAKLLIDIATMNWAYTMLLEPGKAYTFGSAKGNVVSLPSHVAADHHAVLNYLDTWVLEDLGSDAGTFINGQRIATAQPLRDRDILKIGTCEAVYQDPEAKAEAEALRRVAVQQQSHLKNVVDQAERSGILRAEDLRKAVQPQVTPVPDMPKEAASSESSLPGFAAETADLVWVAQTLAAIVQEVLANPVSRDEAYALMLRHLRTAISADNGFVMIPDGTNMRWIIRAWVGDSAGWTDYEKTHPLPLTVTNRAYRMSTIVSNALAGSPSQQADEEPITSRSMEQLQVSSYIAVPLVEKTQKRGVLYFDTRSKDRKFRPRDVQLLQMAGSVILQIEAMK